MSLPQWLGYGKRFVRLGSASNWWIGDWMRYGNARYGEKYGAASKQTGYDRQTLMNMVYVASRFDPARRRTTVSWSHHAELAPLPNHEQDTLLELVEREHLTVRSLRDEIRHRQKRPGSHLSTTAVSSASDSAPVCPLCGGPLPGDRLTTHREPRAARAAPPGVSALEAGPVNPERSRHQRAAARAADIARTSA
jgi:hypothetical protein